MLSVICDTNDLLASLECKIALEAVYQTTIDHEQIAEVSHSQEAQTILADSAELIKEDAALKLAPGSVLLPLVGCTLLSISLFSFLPLFLLQLAKPHMVYIYNE